jgi:hypothetical protein
VLAAVKVLDAFGHRCRRSVVWGGKGIEGMGEWSDVGVLRLRLSPRAREAQLRMTELGWVRVFCLWHPTKLSS